MRVAARWLVLGVCVLVASCGSGPHGTAARQRFIVDNDRICSAVSHATIASLRATFPVRNGLPDVAAARRTGPAFVAAYRGALMRRERLTPPPPDKARFAQHWERYRKALDDLAAVHNRIAAGTTPTEYRAWLTPVSEEFYRLNDFERSYGFKVCGSESA